MLLYNLLDVEGLCQGWVMTPANDNRFFFLYMLVSIQYNQTLQLE